MLRVPQMMTEYVNHQKVNEFYDNKIDDLDKKNSTEANQNIYKEKKIDNLKVTKQNTIDQTKKSEDNHKVLYQRHTNTLRTVRVRVLTLNENMETHFR